MHFKHENEPVPYRYPNKYLAVALPSKRRTLGIRKAAYLSRLLFNFFLLHEKSQINYKVEVSAQSHPR